MIKIVPDKEGKLTQWDLNRKVIITGYEGIAEVHFASPGDDHGAYVVKLVDGQAEIPNILLTMAGTINVYVYPADRTVFATTLWVMAREKPDDYVYTETEVLNWRTLDEKIGDLAELTTTAKENLVAAINEAAQSGSGTNISLGVTGASVGDIIKVKQVDANGKPTAWEAADIIDKPTGGSSSGITDINIKKWVGKKIVIDGSSITAGGTGNTKPVWGSFLKDMFALAECYNHAVSGTGWFFSGDSYVVDRVDSYENDADAVILMGDYNGIYAYTSNAGTIDDAPAADGSYYAKLKYLAEKLITKYPMCPVIWVVEPPRGAQGDGKTPMDYASGYAMQSKCIEEVADYYGFTHCNLMKSTIFRPWNETNYAATTSDGTHPWNNIQRTMAQVIAETMKRTPLIYNESYVNTPGDSSGGDSNKTLTKITATFTQGDAVIKTTDGLDILRGYLRVVATYSDLSEATVTDYTLSGELTEGTSTITVSYGTATTTFTVNVTLDDGSVTVALGDVIDEATVGTFFKTSPAGTTYVGDLNTRDGMRISQYLPVKGGTTITLSAGVALPNLTTNDIVYYNGSKEILGTSNFVYGTREATVPDGASYFRICYDTSDDAKTITYFPG